MTTTVTTPAQRADGELVAFGRAIVFGALVGFPVLALLIALVVRVFAPSTEPVAILGIAVWVGLFCGPFLGGTITVGLFSNRQH